MRGCAPGPFKSIPQGATQPCSRFVKITFLVGDPLYFLVEPKSRTKDLQAQLCGYLKTLGMVDTELFGLAAVLDGEYIFVEPEYKLSKYAPKSWRSSSTNGLDSNRKPLLELFFRVQFYVESPLLIRDELSIEHYFTQIYQNVLERGLLHSSASQQALFILAGLALQAHHGDSAQQELYEKPQQYLPPKMVASCGIRLSKTLASLHLANNGLTQTQARVQYIREASSVDTSPIPHNTHVYTLRSNKQESLPGSVSFAIRTQGIEIYQETPTKQTRGSFLWHDIGKLSFDRKKFEIKGVDSPSSEKNCYYTSSDEKSKHLLSLCKVTHQYNMQVQQRLAQVREREETERKNWKQWNTQVGKSQMRYGSMGEQRISVISSTSSTTTSGIVSDRVHSLDDSEDDLELEILINTPPAPSVKSLALNHLCENGQPGHCPQPNYDSRQGREVDSSKTSPGISATEGSQCSSSASTIVIQQQQHLESRTQQDFSDRRCESVTSSLELGYSHTAQHSAVSESNFCELDCSAESAHASSGVYTLDGSCDTQTIIETVASSSGIGLESAGQRSRSGSMGSTTGSFHGDGSDPSDAGGRGNLLSAEELSDLIVHRSPKPRRGVYPSRATVSSTLDSCSDYVTLPPPPVPPPRADSSGQLKGSYVLLEPVEHQGGYLSPDVYYSQKLVPQIVMAASQPYQLVPPDLIHPLKSQSPGEEVTARFITSKPQINMLAAHSSIVSSTPSYASTPSSSSLRYDPSGRMKLNPSMIPLVGSNNYLDVRGSYLQHYHQPPHLVHPSHQPPPPPPRPNLATVYTSQVTRSQIEQFKQQLYSDVDYVMYPLQDPAISKQDYIDSKMTFGYHPIPPPPYPNGKSLMYRSTPNVAMASGYKTYYPGKYLTHNKFASNQNLSDYYQPSVFSGSPPLYSAATSYSSSSTHSLRTFESLCPFTLPPTSFHRTLSDDNILNCERPVYRRPPPPAPPPELPPSNLVERKKATGVASANAKSTPIKEKENRGPLDISSLREKSKDLDLPLISALCNDKSLIKQTNAFVMPQHPLEKKKKKVGSEGEGEGKSSPTSKSSVLSAFISKSTPSTPPKSSKLKYPVSGLSTNQIVKASRKTISRHKHPETKTLNKVVRSQSASQTQMSNDAQK